ncbi:MAG: hypothetical protein BWY66_00894 [bacterium ADurb.Bin374]|nr:MAG: hypothetical protein BWY66_00894 [bacterium ADurb.Bin374]
MDTKRCWNSRRGQGLFLLLLILVGGIAIWFGYERYQERYYINLFDGEMVRYIDVPPFGVRLTPADDELRGYAELRLEAAPEQACNFFGAIAARRGFIFRRNDDTIEIEVRPSYLVKGTIKEDRLTLNWKPILDGARLRRKAKLEAAGRLPKDEVASSTVGK